jgi:hypothetical protein
MEDRKSAFSMTGRIVAGVILIALGVAFTLDNMDLIDMSSVWQFWPLILVALGLGKLMTTPPPGRPREGWWLLFIGLWLLITELHVFGLWYHNSWPILIIGVGISMLLRDPDRKKWDSTPGGSDNGN